MNRVMLRFRPIAPKPAAGGSGSDGSSMDNKNAFFAKGRTKRKYVRVRKNNSSISNSSGYKRERKIGEEEKKEGSLELEKRVVTLQLLPEKSERSELPESGSWCNFDDDDENGDPPELPMWLNKFDDNKGATVSTDEKDHTAAVESWVTVVESVTDTCMVVGQLGSTDQERMRNLEEDTCPGFVSDGLDRVMWVNRAFKRMLVRKEQNDRQSAENNNNNNKTIMVWLVGKEKLKLKLPYLDEAEAFTCQVKLQHTCGTEKKDNKCSQIVPCDVWRMDSGGFAWRLDVEAALSLGR